MVDYHDPVIVAQEFIALVKLWHFMNGIFIWEFITTLDYEWDVIRRRRPYRWTIWVYSLTRVATLLAIIINMNAFDSTTPINCQAWASLEVFFAYLSFMASSLLIELRIIAIWDQKKIVLVIAMGIWVTDISFLIDGIVRLRSTWSPEQNTCALLNLETTKPAILSILISDVVLLLIMLVGLLRLRLKGGDAFGFIRILWKQGLVWLLLATVAEVPPAVLMCLNLNVPLNLMFQTSCMVTMSIAATRMYRSLVEFSSSEISREGPGRSGIATSEMPIPLTRVDVSSTREEYNPYPTSQMSFCGSCIPTDPQGRCKEHKMNLNVDLESGSEK